MRVLVEGQADADPRPWSEQQRFFDRHIEPWVPQLLRRFVANFVLPISTVR